MFVRRLLMVLLTIACLATSAIAASFNSVVVYGDSLSDNGNLFKATGGVPGWPYYEGRRSDGPVAVEQLAMSLSVPLLDFAWIGATTGEGNYADGGSVTSLGAFGLPGMTNMYAATKVSLSPSMLSGGLFVVWGGPNDFLAQTSLGWPPDAIISTAVSNELAIIMDLKSRGAK